jgi:hypothetical protein
MAASAGAGGWPARARNSVSGTFSAVVWALPLLGVNPLVDSGHQETITTTVSGPARCDPGTSTTRPWVTFQPICLKASGGLGGIDGRFKGTHDVGTIKVSCRGKFAGIIYSATGRLNVSVVK